MSIGEWALYSGVGITVNKKFVKNFSSPDTLPTPAIIAHSLLTAGGGRLLANRCSEAEARAHALLPLAALAFALVELFERDFKLFATQLAHLDI